MGKRAVLGIYYPRCTLLGTRERLHHANLEPNYKVATEDKTIHLDKHHSISYTGGQQDPSVKERKLED